MDDLGFAFADGLQRRTDERRLPGTRLTHEHGQSGTATQPVAQMRQRLFMPRERNRKRGFGDKSKGRSRSP
jgi:hypothetical protein